MVRCVGTMKVSCRVVAIHTCAQATLVHACQYEHTSAPQDVVYVHSVQYHVNTVMMYQHTIHHVVLYILLQ